MRIVMRSFAYSERVQVTSALLTTVSLPGRCFSAALLTAGSLLVVVDFRRDDEVERLMYLFRHIDFPHLVIIKHYWLLAIGCSLLAARYWLLTIECSVDTDPWDQHQRGLTIRSLCVHDSLTQLQELGDLMRKMYYRRIKAGSYVYKMDDFADAVYIVLGG